MKKTKIIALAILIAIMLPFVSAEAVLELNLLVFKSNSVAMEYKVTEGRASLHKNETGSYMLSITDASGAALWRKTYDLNFMKLANPPRIAEYEIITEKLPYDERMYSIAFYKGNEMLLQKYLDVCDYNSVCDKKENAVSCASDCSISDFDGICIAKRDGICDPDCIDDVDCAIQEKKKQYARAVFSIIVSISAVLLALLLHRKKRKIMNMLARLKESYFRLVSELKEMGKPVKRYPRRR